MRADGTIVPDRVVLPDDHVVAGLEVLPDPVAGIDHGVAPDHGVIANDRLQLAIITSFRGVPDTTEWFDDDILPQSNVFEQLGRHATLLR